MADSASIIEFFELEDGEKICIRQYMPYFVLSDEIILDRETAIEMSKLILKLVGEYE